MPKTTKAKEQVPAQGQQKAEPEPEVLTEKVKAPLILGFGDPPGRTFVFVGSEDDKGDAENKSCWYKISPTGGKAWIDAPALTGFVTNLSVTPRKWNKKWGYKLDITVMADREYVVRSGITTSFSKGIVHSMLLVEDFKKPLAIIAEHGDSTKVIFGNLMDADTRKLLIYKEAKQEKLLPLVAQIQEKLGVFVQTSESIKKVIDEAEAKEAGNANGQ